MTDRAQQAAEAYRSHRLEHQRRWYGDRADEFDSALLQLGVASTILLAASATLGALGGTTIGGAEWLAAAATIASAFATAITAYIALQAYERLQKSYSDTAAALRNLDDERERDLPSQVVAAEEVMRVEQGQWGQLIAELPSAEPPKA